MISCVCGREFRTKTIGARVVQKIAKDGPPYKLFSADLLECPGCHHQILQWAPLPIAEHFHPEFKSLVENSAPVFEATR